jgi:hypothetical protein
MLENASDAFAPPWLSPVACLTLSLRVPHRGLMHREHDSARTMHRFLCSALVAVVGLAVAGPAGAQPVESLRVPGSEAVELRRGIGYAALWDRGAVLGRVARGRVRVINLRGGGAPSGWVRGCERREGRLALLPGLEPALLDSRRHVEDPAARPLDLRERRRQRHARARPCAGGSRCLPRRRRRCRQPVSTVAEGPDVLPASRVGGLS